jgi:cytochrome P450
MIVALFLGAFSAAFLYFYTKKRPNPTVPEAPYGLPIVGHIPIMLMRLGKKSLWEWRKSAPIKHGPLMQLRFFSQPMVMVGDGDAAKMILNDPNLMRDPLIQEVHVGVAKYGLFILPGGEVWKMHRKYIQPAFAPSHLKHAFELSVECVHRLKRIWDKKLEGKEYIIEEMHNVATRMAGDIM